MFKRHPKEINGIVQEFMRSYGLETPWLQRRLVEAWDEVAGTIVAGYTEEKSIRNQTLWVRITSPAVRGDLQMRRTELVRQLNQKVGAQVISDIRIY